MYQFYKFLVYFITFINFQSTVGAIDSNKGKLCLELFSESIISGVSLISVYTLMQGDKVVIRPRSKELNVFCYKGKPKYIIHIWQSVIVSYSISL